MFDIDIVKDMQDYYELYFKVTSHHKNRRKNDMQPEFSYAHWLKEATKSEYLKVDPKRYKHEIIRDGPIEYISYSNDMKKNIPLLEKELRNHNQNRKHTKVPHFSECIRKIICRQRINLPSPRSQWRKCEWEKGKISGTVAGWGRFILWGLFMF